MPYVSITGLTLKSPFHAPLFWLYAPRAFTAAQKAPGCLHADARSIDGVQHTWTIWESRKAAMAYVHGPAHKAAMRIYARVADPVSATYGYETDTPPKTWDEARAVWRRHAQPYQGA